ncbi:MAG: ATP-binding protein [Planctomycetota bacterium]
MGILGALGLCGWISGVSILKTLIPGQPSMKANTAIAFVCCSLGLFLVRGGLKSHALITLGRAASALATLIGIATLIQYFTGTSLGIDELLFRDSDRAVGTLTPGRMSPATALAFVVAGSILAAGRRRPFLEDLLSLAVLSLSMIALVGHLFGARTFSALGSSTALALHTAASFLITATALVATNLEGPVSRLFGSESPGGILARRVVPAAIAIPVLLGWLRLMGERAGYFNLEFGLALMVTGHIVLLGSLILWAALSIDRLDLDRVSAEKGRTLAESRVRSLLESDLIGVLFLRDDGTILDANPALLKLLGYSREDMAAGRISWTDVVPVENLAREQKQRAEVASIGLGRPLEMELVRKDGSRVTTLLGVSRVADEPDTSAAFVLDLSDRKRLEALLLQSQRMEVVGRLAGGVAHDFNNLLTPIMGYAETLIDDPGIGDGPREDLEVVVKCARRGADLTRQLLAFSRKQVLQPVVADLNELIGQSLKLLARIIGEDVKLACFPAKELRLIRIDPAQLDQVLLNLAVNARDAMPRGGTLTIETANADLDESYCRLHPEVTPGPFVSLTVSDTGTGMDKETLAHLFEPFFTTKAKGKGTGLGLATVHGIVRQSNGFIWVYSEVGRGSTFKLYLPQTTDAPSPPAPVDKPSPATVTSSTILVVEDDDSLRQFVRKALEARGYRVLDSPDGQSALRLSKTHPEGIDLLLTDVVMPGLSGRELAAQLLASRPYLKILYMSGYTENAIVHHGVLDGGIMLLEKPFNAESLCERVRIALAAAHPAP